MSNMKTRRSFLHQTTLTALGISSVPFLAGAAPREPTERKPPIEDDIVRRFVRAAHSKIDAVQQLLEEHPNLVNASWDWSNGDFETALGAASHMGRKDIAEVLVQAGARTDLFYYAMAGNTEIIRTAVRFNPSTVQEKGPHGIPLMFHAAISGQTPLTQLLFDQGAPVTDGCLGASVRHGRSYAMTAWLLEHGARYYGQKAFGDAPLAEWARKEGLANIADLLDQHFQPRQDE